MSRAKADHGAGDDERRGQEPALCGAVPHFRGRTATASRRSSHRTWRSTRFITADGREMGRAQVVQAEAAGIAPDVRMNPILLKPTQRRRLSQVIIMRRGARADRSARGLLRDAKRQLIARLFKHAFDSLAAEDTDIVVIEGAGSPAEINLKAGRHRQHGAGEAGGRAGAAGRATSTAAACSRQLYGTVALLEQEERARIAGLVINKFRGDVEILRPGLAHAGGKDGPARSGRCAVSARGDRGRGLRFPNG